LVGLGFPDDEGGGPGGVIPPLHAGASGTTGFGGAFFCAFGEGFSFDFGDG